MNPVKLALILFFLCGAGSIHAAPHTLQNGSLVVTVDPEIGRITEFRRTDGENIMCTEHPSFHRPPTPRHTYVAYGGERLWPTQQYIWRFWAGPDFFPDEAIDGQPWKTLTVSARSVTIESQTSSWLGLVARRTLTLDEHKPVLEIVTKLTRVASSQIPVQVWSISAVRNPQFCLLDIAPEWRDNPSAWTELSKTGRLDRKQVQVEKDSIRFTIPENPDAPKIGTMGRWLAAVYPAEIFLLNVDFHPRDCYPDNSSLQVFVGRGLTELETLSPNHFLAQGQSLTSRSVWQLIPRPAQSDVRILCETLGKLLETQPNK